MHVLPNIAQSIYKVYKNEVCIAASSGFRGPKYKGKTTKKLTSSNRKHA